MSAVRIAGMKDDLPPDVRDQNNSSKVRKEEVTKHFKEYAEGTSLHGIKYIGEDGRHICERYI